MTDKEESKKFEFLVKLALKKGAADAKIISVSKVVVEDRVVLKCKVGCSNYGKTLACPPYTPTADEFRKIVSEYGYALFMKFRSNALADAETLKGLSSQKEANASEDVKEKTEKFWADWKADKKKMLQNVVELEKSAMKEGYSLAVSFVSGTCQLCNKCETQTRICVHPELARWSEDAVGVNVRKTAANAGIKFTWPIDKNPESFALLLID